MPCLLILLSVIALPFFFAIVRAEVEKYAVAFCGLWCLVLCTEFWSREVVRVVVGRLVMPKALASAERREKHTMLRPKPGLEVAGDLTFDICCLPVMV